MSSHSPPIYSDDRSVGFETPNDFGAGRWVRRLCTAGSMHVAADSTRPAAPSTPGDARTAEILARSMYKDMKRYGIPRDRILQVASELIGLVTADLTDPAGDR